MEISNSNLKQYQKIEPVKVEQKQPKEDQSEKLQVLKNDTLTLSVSAQKINSEILTYGAGNGGGAEPPKISPQNGGGVEPPVANPQNGGGDGVEPPQAESN